MNGETKTTATGNVWAILGSSGFVGSALLRELEKQGEKVVLIDAPRMIFDGPRTVDALVREICNRETVTKDLGRALEGSSIVVNAAGIAQPNARDSDELFGANSLLPAIIQRASALASSPRFVHVSSAAVQGACRVLDSSTDCYPFSPYSLSKALAEKLLLDEGGQNVSLRVVRATSVQGPNRRTTHRLQKVARSSLSTVARPGNRPSAISSIGGLVDCIIKTGRETNPRSTIYLQPWEGGTTSDVLYWAGGQKRPKELPEVFCHVFLKFAGGLSKLMANRFAGHIRRLEVMWFGQGQSNEGEAEGRQVSDSLRLALSPQPDLAGKKL